MRRKAKGSGECGDKILKRREMGRKRKENGEDKVMQESP